MEIWDLIGIGIIAALILTLFSMGGGKKEPKEDKEKRKVIKTVTKYYGK